MLAECQSLDIVREYWWKMNVEMVGSGGDKREKY